MEILVVAGLMSIVGLAITSVITNSTKSQKRVELKDGQISSANQVRSILQNAAFCGNAFCTAGTTCGAGSFPNLPTAASAATYVLDLQGLQGWSGGAATAQGMLACTTNCGNASGDYPPVAGPWGTPVGNSGLHVYKMQLINFSYQGQIAGNHVNIADLRIRFAGDPKKISGGQFTDSVIRMIFTSQGATGANPTRLMSCTTGSGDSLWEESTTVASDIFYLSGDVGIGNDNPLAPLNVTASNAARAVISADELFQFHDAQGAPNGAINFGTVSNSTTILNIGVMDTGLDAAHTATLEGGFVGTNTAAPLNFRTNALERLRIDAAGNVGVGDIAPVGKLTVELGPALGKVHLGGTNPDLWFTGGADSVFSIGNYGAAGGRTSINYLAAELLTVLNSGNVGIGNNTPGAALDVNGNILLSGAAGRTITSPTGFPLTLTVPGNASMNFSVNGSNRLSIASTGTSTFSDNVTVAAGGVVITAGGINVGAGGATITGASTVNGALGVTGNLSTGANFAVTGNSTIPSLLGNIAHNGNLTGAGGQITGYNVISTSDKTLKQNITELPEQSEFLNQLGTYHFSYINDPRQKKHIGVMAQEIQNFYPELVSSTVDGKLNVNYIELIPVLIKALQESNLQIERLQSENGNFKLQHQEMKADFQQLKNQQAELLIKINRLLKSK